MTTSYVVADGIGKRKPTVEEHELFFGTRLPELVNRFISGGVDPAGVNTTIKQVSDGVVITELKTAIVTPPKPKPEKFKLLATFEVTIPEGYDHATRLDTFAAAHKSEFYYYNPNITDANYVKATTQLTPGRKFAVKVFGIKKTVTSDECLTKLRSERAVLVGAQGASLAYEQGKDNLPKGKWSVSFDEKVALWFGGDYRKVPGVYRDSAGGFRFDLGYWEGGWSDNDCLLCFCDLSKNSDTFDS